MTLQLGLLETKEENLKRIKAHDDQLSLLPVNPLQEKHLIDTPHLTQREFEIMDMVLSGFEIHEIAMKIFISIYGVKWRLSQVYEKFGVKNRLQLIKKASKDGLHFLSENGIKHTFHNNVNMRDHNHNLTNQIRKCT
jgi:ATP/maltotriose-dependent transcriptional regulator MalT